MKKSLALLAVFALLVSSAACSGDASTPFEPEIRQEQEPIIIIKEHSEAPILIIREK